MFKRDMFEKYDLEQEEQEIKSEAAKIVYSWLKVENEAQEIKAKVTGKRPLNLFDEKLVESLKP